MRETQMSQKSRLMGEAGVILPMIAFIAFGLIAVLIVLGVDSYTVKYASSAIQAQTSEICGNLAKDYQFSPRRAVFVFRDQIGTLAAALDSNVELVSARLIIPTHAEEQIFPTQVSSSDSHSTNPPRVAGAASNICGAAILTSAECAGTYCGLHPEKCQFQGDILGSIPESPNPYDLPAPAPLMSDKYPSYLWNNLTNSNNTIGCEIRAKVKTFWSFAGFPSNRLISARSAFWRPAIGEGTLGSGALLTWSRAGSPPPPPEIPYPGLTIAIATEMTTDYALNNRFTFKSPIDADFDAQGYTAAFSWASHAHDASAIGAGSVASVPAPLGSDRAQMIAACANPAALVRNAYLATITELAARHGHFRNYTEIIHANPQYRSVQSSCTTPTGVNFPTVVVPFGADIAQRNFETPYVFYHGGVATSASYPAGGPPLGIPPEFGTLTGEGDRLADGYLDPFPSVGEAAPFGLSSSGQNPQTTIYHSLLAGQLRFCHHLYGMDPGPRASGRPLHRFDRYGLASLYDQTFEPNSLDFTDAQPIKRDPYAGSGDTWDQDCPWQFAPAAPAFAWSFPPAALSCPSYTLHTRKINAAELVSTLGTTQRCPYPFNDGLNVPNTCTKPDISLPTCSGVGLSDSGPYELRADLIATLNYITRATGVIPLPGVPAIANSFPAVNPPGLFKLAATDSSTPDWVGLSDPAFPFGSSKYTPAYSDSSTLLLVVHQRLNTVSVDASGAPLASGTGTDCSRSCAGDDSEYCRIRNLVNTMTHTSPFPPNNPVRRPIVVVYIPTNYIDASGPAIESMRCAFQATEDIQNLSSNYLRVLSPNKDAKFLTTAAGCGSLDAANQDTCFRDYWDFLLNPPALYPDQNPVGIATEDFNKRLTNFSILF